VNPTFSRRQDHVIDVELGDSYRWFTEALLDAVTTRAPRGSGGVNPSTYWIDRTLTSLSSGDGGLIASGNAWDLLVENGCVVARSQYDVAEPQRVPIGDFIATLTLWRKEVINDREQDR
jgi:hypothetical protein